MNLSDKLTIPTEVMARQVGNETVVLNLASGMYFGLDPVGARMWELLGESRTLAEVCVQVASEYEVKAEELEQDVLDLTGQLLAHGLVLVSAP
jgi:hypothetical protein